ncbi:MAG TPA: tetratricopeptide repeat protein [Opitutaceae bacterium]|nr:tetratricopeptide repeat protein [Opitutaceae bacterium]
MSGDEITDLIEDATFEFTMGDHASAIAKLEGATAKFPDRFDAWHALAEIKFSLRDLDGALAAAEAAHRLRPDDLFVNTTLSRVWMERGDKTAAEHFGARAKVLSWKEQLKPDSDAG